MFPLVENNFAESKNQYCITSIRNGSWVQHLGNYFLRPTVVVGGDMSEITLNSQVFPFHQFILLRIPTL